MSSHKYNVSRKVSAQVRRFNTRALTCAVERVMKREAKRHTIADRMDDVIHAHERDFGHPPQALELTTDEWLTFKQELGTFFVSYEHERATLPAGAVGRYMGAVIFLSRGVRI